MQETLFTDSRTLFHQINKILEKVGAEKFFSSSDEEVKKAREGFVAYFFMLTLKKYSGKDWWLAQYDQVTREYPDFDLMYFPENLDDMKIEPVELTGIYPHFKSFDEALKVVKKKQKQYGNKPIKCSLLVFVNHEKSEEWIDQLRNSVKIKTSFLNIWTIHLLLKNDRQEVIKVIAQRIVPLPYLKIETDTDDSEIYTQQPLPHYMKQIKDDKTTYITFKTEFINEIRKRVRRLRVSG